MGTAPPIRALRAGMPVLLPAVLVFLLFLLPGCAGVPQLPTPSDSDVGWVLTGADLLPPSTPDTGMEDVQSLLHVSDEMRKFAIDNTSGMLSVTRRTQALAAAMASPTGLNLQYDAEATKTAEQAFREHSVNCLSYALLFVALAREVGIPARFNDVAIPPVWDIGDEQTAVLYRHINVRVDLMPPFYQIIDVSGDDYDPGYDQHIIPDIEVLAQFYNNRSVELRLQKRYTDSLRYQLRSVQLAPRIDYLWSNLAGLYLVMDSPKAARIAISRALALDPSSMMNDNIAAAVYERLGDHHTAQAFLAQAHYFLEQNPYYHYQRALAALKTKDDDGAYDEIRQAILLQPREHRFYFLAAVIVQQMGRTQLANALMHNALELAPSAAQQERYQNKFARLSHQG